MDENINLLKWYPFEENADILEICNNDGFLENLEKTINLKKTDIKELNIEGKYDYITAIGTYEYAPTIIDGEKPYSEFLKILKQHLKPNRENINSYR